MPGLPPDGLVGLALRCYPRRWRRRHGAEAAELAALLIRDGVPARSIACSYLCGAARAWLTPQPGHRLAAAAVAVLVVAGSLGVPLGLLSASAPASAASAARAHPASPGAWPRCAGAAQPAPGPAPAPRPAPAPGPAPAPAPGSAPAPGRAPGGWSWRALLTGPGQTGPEGKVPRGRQPVTADGARRRPGPGRGGYRPGRGRATGPGRPDVRDPDFLDPQHVHGADAAAV